MKVGILGGGAWGQALARLVMAAGNEPIIAYRDVKPPQMLPSSDDPPAVSAQCELLLAAVSASELRSAIRLAQPGPQHRVVVAGRGVEPGTGAWLTDVVLDECDALRVGALVGPSPVHEILNGGLCAGVVASAYDEVRKRTVDALHSTRYRVYGSTDLAGVQLAGAVVPVLATLLGVARNLQGAGVGVHALVLTRGLAEVRRLVEAVGADPTTFSGLAGVGDLVAAQGREGHPHFDAGAALATGDTSVGPESLARTLVGLAREHHVELPLIEALVAIYEGLPPVEAVQLLMARPAQREHR
jgi:glycerol-3-phosphate dehydrogenase (NAD(P)+)